MLYCISAALAKTLAATWDKEKIAHATMTYLMSLNLTAKMARRIWDEFGSDAEAAIKENPYQLAWAVDGIGFQRADQIGRDALGFDVRSPYRLDAGVIHVLKEARSNGHIYLPRETLVYGEGAGMQKVTGALEMLRGLGEGDAGLVEETIDRLGERSGPGSVVADDDRVYLPYLYRDETSSADRVQLLLAGDTLADTQEIDIDARMEWAQQEAGITLNAEQEAAVRAALTSKVSVTTGAAGVGKTTVLRVLIHILQAERIGFALMAPTGKAANRMAEATGCDAMTLHRGLEFSPASFGFKRDEADPLDADVVIVDEASMIDVSLGHALLRAVKSDAHLLFVGDQHQLPSVGPGSVLGDLIASGCVPATHLTQIYRQDENSGIVPNAHAINTGQMPHLMNGETNDFFFASQTEAESVADEIVSLVSRRIPAKFDIDSADIQVLSPSYKRACGVSALNTALQNALNPHGAPVWTTGFRVGDKVLQLKNDYDREVWNGDQGLIVHVDGDAMTVRMDADARRVLYNKADLDNLTLAYAMTVHKSQGSGFPAVVVACHSTHQFMMQRNLLYTAVTRAEKLVILVGVKKALYAGVKRDDQSRRYSQLAARLRGEIEAQQAAQAVMF